MGKADGNGRRIRRVEGDALCVQVDWLGTVVDLIGYGVGGIVVVGGADVPDVLRDAELALVEVLGVGAPNARDDVQLPLVRVGHFENGQHFRKVILDTGDVHLIEQDEVHVVVVAGRINSAKELGLVVVLGKFVEVAEELGPVTPGWLYGGDGGVHAQELAEGVRQRGFTGTGDTLQDDELGGSHARNEQPDGLDVVEQAHARAGKVPERLAELLQRDRIVVNGRDVGLVEIVDVQQLGEAFFVGDENALPGCGLFALLLALLGAARKRHGAGVCQCRALPRHADLGHLHGHDFILFPRHFEHAALQDGNLLQQVLVAHDGVAEAHVLPETEENEHHDSGMNRHDDNDGQNGQYPRQRVELRRILFEYSDVIADIEYLQDPVEYPRKDHAEALQHFGDKREEPFQKRTHALNPLFFRFAGNLVVFTSFLPQCRSAFLLPSRWPGIPPRRGA